MLGLVCATFFGGAIRTLLHSDRVHDRIVSELKARFPQHEFQIGQTEVLLAHGVWPSFGLKLRDVVFKQDVCGKLSFTLTLPETILPLDMMALLIGKVRLNEVEIIGGGMLLDYRACPPKLEVQAAVVPTAPTKMSITPPKLEWEKAARVLNGLVIHDFTITYEKNSTWKLLAKRADVSLSQEMYAHAAIEVQKILPTGQLTHPVEFDVHADKRVLQWNVTAGMKEGAIHVGGQLDADTQGARASVDLRQLPIKDFMSEMFQMGFVDYDLKLKATWLSCGLKWEGLLQDYTSTPVRLSECRVEGGYGRTELSKAEFWMGTPEFFREPVHLKVTQLQMQPVVEALGRQVLPAVISQLGVWSGQVEFKNSKFWSLEGELQNTEFVFANQSLHGKQIAERAHTRASQKNGVVELRIDDVKLREGDFSGELLGDLSSDWRSGAFTVAVKKLVLAPAIQRLLVGGRIGPLNIEGAGTLSGGELSQWHGTFTVPTLAGDGWTLQSVQVQSTYRTGSFAFDALAKTVKLDRTLSFYSQLKPLIAESPEGLTWHEVTAKVEVQKEGGTLHSLNGSLEGGGAWRAKGSWERDREFFGVLNIPHAKRTRTYSLLGERGNIRIQERL